MCPVSHYNQLNQISQTIASLNPKKILDIGPGFGTYGVLSREYLEVWGKEKNYNQWQKTIDAIEVFPKYLTPLHDFIYNKIYVGNALKVLPTLKTKYDLILLIDVLEHFSCKDGQKLIYLCKKKAKNIIVSTPRRMSDQKDTFGNSFETHLCQWQKKDFEKNKPNFRIPNEFSFIYFIGQDSKKVHKILQKEKTILYKEKIKNLIPFYQKIKRNSSK
ncbi:MAG: small ribosomal subunit Rsm22 family protein [Patescibacteria group bacterium]|nr:small ribosomal subunit Rsm22 family protein [Patescibacteria group bacterium]